MQITLQNTIRIVLYAVIVIQIPFLLSDHANIIVLMIGILLIIPLILRIVLHRYESNPWIKIKQKLKVILIQNQIIEDDEHLLTEPKSPQYVNQYQSDDQLSLIYIDPSSIDNLRSIGLDGVLICLYLLKNRESFCSVKKILKELRLPKTTAYRVINKLTQNQYIIGQSSLDDPKTSFYKINYEGEVLMRDFYQFLDDQYFQTGDNSRYFT